MLDDAGPRSRRVRAFLARRERGRPGRRAELDQAVQARFFRPRAIVFSDTADFTARTLRDGILHFMMVFERAVRALRPVVRRAGGRLVKVEADSLMLCFPDPAAACRGVLAVEAGLRRLNRGRPANERLRFSYGIGYGELLELEKDLFGLEVNLASKLGEDLAKPGEALLTPAAAASLDARTLKRVTLHKIVTYGDRAIPVQRLRLATTRRPRER
jgi:class 3 adenylate cyclase